MDSPDRIDHAQFIEDIINGMYDWVRVMDRNDRMLFINKAMSDGLGSSPLGETCYSILGRSAPCENCVARKAVFEGRPHEKEEVVNGKIFSVMSSPVRNRDGEIIAVVEVLRDVTQMKKLQQKIVQQNKKLQADLSIAKKLQCSLLPRKLPEDKINFSFVYRPCESLGGDFLDIFSIDSDHIGIYIADVSGHGVSASMLTVFLRSSINKKSLSPAEVLNELYRDFNENNFDPDLYIAVFYAIIDFKKNKITFANAGLNECPILFNKDRLEILRSPGVPISNWMDSPEYFDRSIPLQQGDRIFLCTDGITEIKNREKEYFGEDRLLDILLKDPSEPSVTLNRIIEEACQFAGIESASEIPDDITLALLEMK